MIVPAHISGYKHPRIELAAVFEPHEWFKVENEVSADHVLFNFPEKTILVMVIMCGYETVRIHEQTKVGQPDLVATDEPKTLVH